LPEEPFLCEPYKIAIQI